MIHTVIQYHLDLLIRLVDTTTGGMIVQKNVRLYRDSNMIAFLAKEAGTCILYNTGRKDFTLKVWVQGYEEMETAVRYSELDRNLPTIYLPMVPALNNPEHFSLSSLEGFLPGIEKVEAVQFGIVPIRFNEFDERKRIITLFNPHGLTLNHFHYGIINQEKLVYEPVTVVKAISSNSIKIDHTLERDYEINFPVSRVIFGMTYPEGRYILRIHNDSVDLRYLVRYIVKGCEKFKLIDFNRPEDINLA